SASEPTRDRTNPGSQAENAGSVDGGSAMKRSEVTYGQLDRVLRSLGFSCRVITDKPPPARVYQHQQAGTQILLPAFPLGDRVFARHLITVQGGLDRFGIAHPSGFAAKLQKAG